MSKETTTIKEWSATWMQAWTFMANLCVKKNGDYKCGGDVIFDWIVEWTKIERENRVWERKQWEKHGFQWSIQSNRR